MAASISSVKWRLLWLLFLCAFYCYCACDEKAHLTFFSLHSATFVLEHVVCGIFFVHFGHSVIFAIFPRTCTLSHWFLLLRISVKYGQRVFFHRCDLRILELVFGRLWYREVCHVVDHNFLSVFSKREICKLNRCSIRFALGKQLPFVFWVNESFLRFLCWGLQSKSRLIHSVLLVCLLGRKVMDVTYYATGSWSF